MGFFFFSMFCCAILVLQSPRLKRESWLLCVCVFLVFCDCSVALPDGMLFLIVVFPDHNHVFFADIMASNWKLSS